MNHTHACWISFRSHSPSLDVEPKGVRQWFQATIPRLGRYSEAPRFRRRGEGFSPRNGRRPLNRTPLPLNILHTQIHLATYMYCEAVTDLGQAGTPVRRARFCGTRPPSPV